MPRNRTAYKTKAEQGGDSVRLGSRRNARGTISTRAGTLSPRFVYMEKEFCTRLAQIEPHKTSAQMGEGFMMS